jgi:hypothetical protein
MPESSWLTYSGFFKGLKDMKKLALVLFFSPILAFAEELVVVEPGIVLFLQKMIDLIPGGLPTVVSTALYFVCDLIIRLKPTVKPKSLFLVIAKCFNMAGTLLTKISALLDKVVQNLKDPE